ncbi:MAG TPA: PHB depolymerase family esterase, partial [Candidatus Limnocylindrales bacterium]
MASAHRELISFTHNGVERPYLIQACASGAGVAERVPLVLELHGRGIDAVRFDQLTGFGVLADEAGFALALPNAVGEIWNDGRDAAPEGLGPDDIGYLIAVLDDVCARLPIDPRRIYVVGMSNGAAMAG